MADSGSQTSIYLSAEDRRILSELEARTGLGRSAVIRWALHNAYEKEGGEWQVERMEKIRDAAEQILSLTLISAKGR